MSPNVTFETAWARLHGSYRGDDPSLVTGGWACCRSQSQRRMITDKKRKHSLADVFLRGQTVMIPLHIQEEPEVSIPLSTAVMVS